MLSWLTGVKGSEEVPVSHSGSFIEVLEAPETPAPVFAVRAFKHAIFGTPKPVDAHDHFDDIAAKMASKPSNPDAAATVVDRTITLKQRRDDIQNMLLPDTLGLSPTKPNGILMTPGTTRRNKTVTFGAQVLDNEGKKQSTSGLPNSCPGKFPSPWTPKTTVDGLSEISTLSQKRTKLTQTFHEVRDSSRTKSQPDKLRVKSKDDMDITLDFMEPRSQSGKYWKQEYDAYAEKTQREVKKLLMKQKAAKDYAKDKDAEVVQLTEQVRQEKTKAEKLEAKFNVLESQMRDLKETVERGTAGVPSDGLKGAQNEAARLRLENWKLREDLERAQGKTPKAGQSPRRRPAVPARQDIWAEAVLSSPFVVEASDKSPKRTAPSEAAAHTTAPPLRSRDMNVIASGQRRSPSKPRERTVDLTPKRNVAKSTPRSSRDSNILPEDSIDMTLALPQPSPDSLPYSPPQATKSTPRSARKSAAEKTVDDLLDKYLPAKSLIMSSPPPKFDRLALPMGMPLDSQQRNLRKKPSLKESFAQAGSPNVENVKNISSAKQHPAYDEKENMLEGVETVQETSQKKTISEEKRLAALERIAARRAAAKNKPNDGP